MANRQNSYKVSLDVELGQGGTLGPPSPDTPFCLAILGDFTGTRSWGSEGGEGSFAARRPILVDVDNVHELAGLVPELRVSLEGGDGPAMRLSFRTLDDFHPDELYVRLPFFRALRETRRRLADPTTLSAALAEMVGDEDTPPDPAEPQRQVSVPENFLDAVVAETAGDEPSTDEALRSGLGSFLRRIVRPHLVTGADPRQAELLAEVDEAITAEMRRILHDPGFQGLEALWRAVFFLIAGIDSSVKLRVYLVDVSRDELAADLAQGSGPEATATYRVLTDPAGGLPEGARWAALVLAQTLDNEDVDLAFRLASVARRAAVPVFAGAGPSLVGLDRFEGELDFRSADELPGPAWRGFRESPVAGSLGLAAPRFLVRLPYGEDTDECEQFSFEEVGPDWTHENYLWANAAFLCALLLARSFSDSRWGLRPGQHRDVDALPLHLYEELGSAVAKPCAEVLLRERDAERILESGVMPVLSWRDQDRVRLVRFQSVAEPLQPLAAWWLARSTE